MSEHYPPPGGEDRPEESGWSDWSDGGSPPPPPPPGTPPYGTPPAYGAPMGGYGPAVPLSHTGATTSLALGITSIAVAVIGACLCGFLGALGALVGPFGIWQGLRARSEIDADPARYGNRGNAVAGLVCSIIGTVLGVLTLLGTLAVLAFIGLGAFSGPGY
ncbi:hypothetical protein KUV85_16155 [Nocardioides panacisoli]|uniref:hypothetical protein n=1 Tax=Nocardioides panacisoli TaxID=627624 RepID=UPI001C6351C7|nr:hypothetical protein [Nocardioides panacisoli]QYJ03835.1 hypothetical protein KUV85_16155 [Nocardioides panacisoli]